MTATKEFSAGSYAQEMIARVKARARIAGQQGKLSTVTKRAKIQQAAVDSGRTKLTPEVAAIIRSSDESGAELGRRYGINRTLAARIKAGTAWREYKATPFSGLGVR